MKLIKFFFILFLLSLLTSDILLAKGGKPKGHSYKGGKAIDGDTFRYGKDRYRIQQYNAPEIGQPGAGGATRKLQEKLDSGKYSWEPVARDKYGREIVKEREK